MASTVTHVTFRKSIVDNFVRNHSSYEKRNKNL
jgi:hypothetical protein